MSNYGLEVYDDNGNVIFDTDMPIASHQGTFQLRSDQMENIYLLDENGFFYIENLGYPAPSQKLKDFNGLRISLMLGYLPSEHGHFLQTDNEIVKLLKVRDFSQCTEAQRSIIKIDPYAPDIVKAFFSPKSKATMSRKEILYKLNAVKLFKVLRVERNWLNKSEKRQVNIHYGFFNGG